MKPSASNASTILVCQCCYCLVYYRTKPGQGAPGGVSHGICPVCWPKIEQKLNLTPSQGETKKTGD